jgi:hypothetical protein
MYYNRQAENFSIINQNIGIKYMVDFKSLKKNRGQQLKDLQQTLDKPRQSNAPDDRMWKLTRDSSKNGFAIIRFLPSQHNETPYVRLFNHGFQNEATGQWYIENSRTTLGREEPDPLSEYNRKLWNDDLKEQAQKQKRTLNFYCNILIVKDPAHPENEGTVRLFRFGKKIFERIEEAFRPPFDQEGRSVDNGDYNPENAFNPFDLFEGKNFALKIRMDGKFPTYDKSEWLSVSAAAKTEKEMETIFEQTHDVDALIAPDQFKSYEELSARLNKVMGWNSDGVAVKPPVGEAEAPSAGKTAEYSTPDEDDDDPLDVDALIKQLNEED